MSQAVLDRLTFGAKSAELSFVQRNGISRWIESQLSPTSFDSEVEKSLKYAKLRISYKDSPDFASVNENRPLENLNKPIQELWYLGDRQLKVHNEERMRPLRELCASRLLHAANSQWQIRELMVDFWHNHFNIYAGDAPVALTMPSFERECIRKHSLGNFSTLLESVATSPAMLIYLNNRTSKTGSPNENYARELFELHTLGKKHYLNELYSKWRHVPGAENGGPQGYIDQDVYEAARAFTGWAIEDGRNMGGNVKLPQTGNFIYLESWHDPYQKRVLAQEFDPHMPAMYDGKRVLEVLARHQGTAEHICEKLCRRFVSDTPPTALVASCAKVWIEHIKHPEQIAKVLEHLFLSPTFTQSVESSHSKKLKRPLELAISFVRKLDLPLAPSQQLVNEISAAGQLLYMWPTPDGHPDATEYWVTSQSLKKRWLLPLGLIENTWGTGIVMSDHLTQLGQNAKDEHSLIRNIAEVLLGVENSKLSLSQLSRLHFTQEKKGYPMPQDEWASIKKMIAYLAMSPSFQWK